MEKMEMDAGRDDSLDPYVLLLLKLSRELESMKESKPKTVDKLKNLLANKCCVTRFSLPYKLLMRYNQAKLQIEVDDQPVLKVFPFYERVHDKDNAWKKPFLKMLKFLKYKSNSFHVSPSIETQNKIEQTVAGWIASFPDANNLISPNAVSAFLNKCVLIKKMDPDSIVQDLLSHGYVEVGYTGGVSYQLSGVEIDQNTADSARSFEEYLKFVVGRLKVIKQRPKTQQALVNFIKPFMNVMESVDPSQIVKKCPEIKFILKKLVIREFHLSIEKLSNDYVADKEKDDLTKQGYKPIRGRGRGRGRGNPLPFPLIGRGRGRGRGRSGWTGRGGRNIAGEKRSKPNKSLVDVLLKSNELFESVSTKWNAPLSPIHEEIGIARVAEWMKKKSTLFESGLVSTHRELLQQALQCNLFREQVPVQLVMERLEQSGIIRVQSNDELEYDFKAMTNLRDSEVQMKKHITADSHKMAGLMNRLELVDGTNIGKSSRGKRGRRGRGRGVGTGRKKRGRYN